jgi:hypothetical protein
MRRWPTGTRLILRKERPHPGAQLRFTDSDGHRVTAFITDTGHGVVPGQLGGLELRHRQHARVEDRIRQAKATGLRNLPCHRAEANAAWLEIILQQQIWWPGHNCSALPVTPIWPAAKSRHSATGYCTSPPASPAVPDKSDSASTPPGAGPPPSPKHGSKCGKPSPDLTHHPPDRPGNLALERPPTERHRPTCHIHLQQSDLTADQHRPHPPRPGRMKNRG